MLDPMRVVAPPQQPGLWFWIIYLGFIAAILGVGLYAKRNLK